MERQSTASQIDTTEEGSPRVDQTGRRVTSLWKERLAGRPSSARRAKDTLQTMAQAAPVAEKAKVGTKVWIGRGISAVVVAFMLFDGVGSPPEARPSTRP